MTDDTQPAESAPSQSIRENAHIAICDLIYALAQITNALADPPQDMTVGAPRLHIKRATEYVESALANLRGPRWKHVQLVTVGRDMACTSTPCATIGSAMTAWERAQHDPQIATAQVILLGDHNYRECIADYKAPDAA